MLVVVEVCGVFFCDLLETIKYNNLTGDGGAPLVCDNMLVGIGSWASLEMQTYDCAADGEPDFFTNVPYYKEWIEDTVTNMLIKTNLI